MLQVLDYSILGPGGYKIVSRLRLQVRPGESVGLLGGNGSGKSLLVASWMRALPVGMQSLGWVAYQDTLLHDSFGVCEQGQSEILGHFMTFVHSEPELTLNPAITAMQQLEQACFLQQGLSLAERLEVVELPQYVLARYPAYLSSGQRQRLAVACALLKKGVLICDDPVSSMDPLLRNRLFDFWKKAIDGGDLGLLLLSARRSELPGWLTKTQELRKSESSFYAFSTLQKSPQKEILLEIRNLSVFRAKIPVLQGVNLTLRQGELHILLGESGSGKSTLLDALTRSIPCEPGGQIQAVAQDLLALKPDPRKPDPPAFKEIRQQMRIAFQDPVTAFAQEQSIRSVLDGMDRRLTGKLATFLREILTPWKSSTVQNLSSWTKRALALAAALSPKMKILLVDEPFAGADDEHLHRLWEGLVELAGQGIGILIVTHVLPPDAHHVWFLRNGQIVEGLSGPAWREAAKHPYAIKWLAAASSGRPAPGSALQAVSTRDPEPLAVTEVTLSGDASPIWCAAFSDGKVYLGDGAAWRLADPAAQEELGLLLALQGQVCSVSPG